MKPSENVGKKSWNKMGDMTKMPPRPYKVKTFKILLQTHRSMALELGIMYPNTNIQDYSNDDLGMTLTFIRQGQVCFLVLLYMYWNMPDHTRS